MEFHKFGYELIDLFLLFRLILFLDCPTSLDEQLSVIQPHSQYPLTGSNLNRHNRISVFIIKSQLKRIRTVNFQMLIQRPCKKPLPRLQHPRTCHRLLIIPTIIELFPIPHIPNRNSSPATSYKRQTIGEFVDCFDWAFVVEDHLCLFVDSEIKELYFTVVAGCEDVVLLEAFYGFYVVCMGVGVGMNDRPRHHIELSDNHIIRPRKQIIEITILQSIDPLLMVIKRP